jgi:hypothetical protein
MHYEGNIKTFLFAGMGTGRKPRKPKWMGHQTEEIHQFKILQNM